MIYIPAYEPHRFLQIYQHYAYTFIVQIFGQFHIISIITACDKIYHDVHLPFILVFISIFHKYFII